MVQTSRFLARPFSFLVISITRGNLIGTLPLAGQTTHPDCIMRVANSGAVWVVVAFVLDRIAGSWRPAARSGSIALVGEVIGYYVSVWSVVGAYSPSGFVVIGRSSPPPPIPL